MIGVNVVSMSEDVSDAIALQERGRVIEISVVMSIEWLKSCPSIVRGMQATPHALFRLCCALVGGWFSIAVEAGDLANPDWMLSREKSAGSCASSATFSAPGPGETSITVLK